MPPKKTASGASKKAATASHPSYQDMIKEAVISLKERAGSSRQALKKYVLANNNLAGVSDAAFTTQFNRALQKGSDSGVFARPKGASGPVKLAAPGKTADKPAAKAPAKKTATKAAGTKKPATKKTTTKTTKAKTATKKAPAAKKTATKKTATKTKANTGKARKTPTAAPAVQEKKPVVLGKTKSGRVTKSSAPQPVAKKTAPKKAAAKKAAPKKAATPKKA